ncbi:EexN family lipoprotein [Bartonella vinsonii]|uniref:EexN family lipoprotein n=1 Tax=Bartonella vinsonii TaxID=33047 RepID=A0A448V7Y7_BARVI|nr:EexN family lipoprotein [Bartonella vinsonii]VEJ45875.1 Uncharacterised protein [Bartonella vinsonii]
MKKAVIIALLLCTGIVAAGCEKTYSVEEFKKDEKLLDEWVAKCEKAEPSVKSSQNCKNAGQALGNILLGQ